MVDSEGRFIGPQAQKQNPPPPVSWGTTSTLGIAMSLVPIIGAVVTAIVTGDPEALLAGLAGLLPALVTLGGRYAQAVALARQVAVEAEPWIDAAQQALREAGVDPSKITNVEAGWTAGTRAPKIDVQMAPGVDLGAEAPEVVYGLMGPRVMESPESTRWPGRPSVEGGYIEPMFMGNTFGGTPSVPDDSATEVEAFTGPPEPTGIVHAPTDLDDSAHELTDGRTIAPAPRIIESESRPDSEEAV